MHTATPNLADIVQCTYIPTADGPPQSSVDALHTATPNLADIAQCTYIQTADGPHSIEHRCLAYHYTKLGRYSTMHTYMDSRWTPSQLSIDALYTTTQNLADIAQCTYIWTADGPSVNQA